MCCSSIAPVSEVLARRCQSRWNMSRSIGTVTCAVSTSALRVRASQYRCFVRQIILQNADAVCCRPCSWSRCQANKANCYQGSCHEPASCVAHLVGDARLRSCGRAGRRLRATAASTCAAGCDTDATACACRLGSDQFSMSFRNIARMVGANPCAVDHAHRLKLFICPPGRDNISAQPEMVSELRPHSLRH